MATVSRGTGRPVRLHHIPRWFATPVSAWMRDAGLWTKREPVYSNLIDRRTPWSIVLDHWGSSSLVVGGVRVPTFVTEPYMAPEVVMPRLRALADAAGCAVVTGSPPWWSDGVFRYELYNPSMVPHED